MCLHGPKLNRNLKVKKEEKDTKETGMYFLSKKNSTIKNHKQKNSTKSQNPS